MKILFSLLITSTLFLGCQPAPPPAADGPSVLIVGGDMHHDFDAWYKTKDANLLRGEGAQVTYTDDVSMIVGSLDNLDVLFLANNQAIPDNESREAIMDYANAGGRLLLAHPALWYNFADWPAYNATLAGGGSRGHPPYGPFEVTVTNTEHPIMAMVPATFEINDELYYYKADENGSPIEVLAEAFHEETGEYFPSVFVVNHPTARIVGIALGHDGGAHELAAYEQILKNSFAWLMAE